MFWHFPWGREAGLLRVKHVSYNWVWTWLGRTTKAQLCIHNLVILQGQVASCPAVQLLRAWFNISLTGKCSSLFCRYSGTTRRQQRCRCVLVLPPFYPVVDPSLSFAGSAYLPGGTGASMQVSASLLQSLTDSSPSFAGGTFAA